MINCIFKIRFQMINISIHFFRNHKIEKPKQNNKTKPPLVHLQKMHIIRQKRFLYQHV
ncbi:hypothetical protein SEEM1156_04938 [Salmonella enterica subsp. enterica serovar Montevideo str. 315731156]|nr:hypothetical protein SEEM1156_04938 [Salmonella enterica subsp. enterica serovar Montevideo str. 315731156]